MEGENSDSTNTSGTSTPAVQEAPGMSASAKRFDYLLQQTELFSHFMGNKSNSPQKVCYTLSLVIKFNSVIQSKAGRKKKVVEGRVEGDSRHRKTEQEEDEELLSDLNAAKSNVIQFDESPNYIKSGKMRDYQVNHQQSMLSCSYW